MTPQELKSARKRLGLTQAELARLLGVEPQTVRRYETAEHHSTHRPVSGPVETAVAYMLAHGTTLAEDRAAQKR